MALVITRADFEDPALAAFLQAHLDDLEPTAPAESRHALDLGKLQAPGVRLWVAYDGDELVGTGALVTVEPGHDELKSMRTHPARRGQGIGAALVAHLLADARERGLTRVSLETGSMDFFVPAWALYTRAGFVPAKPFGRYREDPNSVFFSLEL